MALRKPTGMTSAKEKRITKGILHNIAESRISDIITDLILKLNKTDVKKINITINLDAVFDNGITKEDIVRHKSKRELTLMK